MNTLKWPSHVEAHVIVTVEKRSGEVLFKEWKGSSARAIRKKAKETYYPDRVSFGNAFYTYSWGGH